MLKYLFRCFYPWLIIRLTCTTFVIKNVNLMLNTGSASAIIRAAHDKELDSNPDWIGIWKCWSLRRGENWSTQRKISLSKEENRQQTQQTYVLGPGIEPRTYWWEVCALTTAPTLLPLSSWDAWLSDTCNNFYDKTSKHFQELNSTLTVG